jgi:WD40 repeat protein
LVASVVGASAAFLYLRPPRPPDNDLPPRLVLRGHQEAVFGLAFSPDGKRLASAGGFWDRRGEVKVWDLTTGRERLRLAGHTATVQGMAFTPDGRTLATASRRGGGLRRWDSATGQERAGGAASAQGFEVVCFAGAGRMAVTQGRGKLTVWDLMTGQEAAHRLPPKALPGHAMALSAKGNLLATHRGRSGTIRLLDLTGERGPVDLRRPARSYGNCLAFSCDGRRLALATWPGAVELWDLGTGRLVAAWQGHADQINALAFAPDGRTLATASHDRTVKLWDLASGEERLTLRGHTGAVTALAFSRDGRALASGSYDKTVIVWDLAAAPGG